MTTAADDCLFCRIITKEEPASMVYENDSWLGFMDLRQVPHGHCLVVPRRHVRNIFDLDDETGVGLAAALRHLALAVRRAFAAEGITISQSNEPPWQDVFHLHFHVLPRYRGDGLYRIYPGPVSGTLRQELDRQAGLIREALEAVR